MELTHCADGRYEIDFELMEHTITPRTRVFMLCNPHNPVGRVYTRAELEQMAELCLRHEIFICADEIHCELLYKGIEHAPIAALAPEVAQRTITLMAPSKTFNIAGLHCSVAIIENETLREQFVAAKRGLVSSISITGYVAALAAYRDGQPWLDALLRYLEGNRDLVTRHVNERLPGVSMAKPEGTYLAWLDCRKADIGDNTHEFFLEKARVALNEGSIFGQGGQGFARLNFGCCREILQEALSRMEDALLAHRAGATGAKHS
jgi:cystathionine beta-lyase